MKNKLNLMLLYFEFYLIPLFFTIGLIGNLFGSICLLANKKLRRKTPLFILASIGFSDTFLLISQFQRWLAIFYDQNIFLVSNSLCKVYFMILRCSIIISSSLCVFLVIIRFISLFLGNFRLSIYSNLGQMCSRLCVAYIISIGVSLSWHELWTSGLKNGNKPIVEIEADYETDVTTSSPPLYENLKCSKNVISYEIIEMINRIYFFIMLIICFILIVFPFMLIMKIRRNRLKDLENCTYRESIKRTKKRSKKSYSLPAFHEPVSNTESIAAFEENGKRKTYSIGEIRSFLKETPNQTNLKLKNKRKKFSFFICFISFMTGIFCLPYSLLDLSYYKDAQISIISNVTIKNDSSYDELKRLPLIFIIIPHSIKFYVLFIFYSKFRKEMSEFLKIRFYINFYMIKNQFKFKRAQSHFDEGIELSRLNRKKHSVSQTKRYFFKFVFMDHFSLSNDKKSSISSQSVCDAPCENTKYKKNDLLIEFKSEKSIRTAESESETSSICGYNGYSNNKRNSINAVINIPNQMDACELDINLAPCHSNISQRNAFSSSIDEKLIEEVFVDSSNNV